METEQNLRQRERRFEVADLTGFDAIVSRTDDDSRFFAELLDFSRTGVKFSLPFFAKFDELLDIQFKLKNSELQYSGTGRVRHIRSIEQNRWQVGCSLDPPLPDEVVGFLAKTTNQERRRFERIEVEGHQGNLLRQGKIDGTDAKLINVSKGGFCLWVAQEHRTGEQVEFVIANKLGEDEKIVARIRWQTASEGGFRLGCSFADSTSYVKLVDCIVKKQEAAAGESINWYVAAAAILVMFIPPASYFLLGFGNRNTLPEPMAAVADNTQADPIPPIDLNDSAVATHPEPSADDQSIAVPDVASAWPGSDETVEGKSAVAADDPEIAADASVSSVPEPGTRHSHNPEPLGSPVAVDRSSKLPAATGIVMHSPIDEILPADDLVFSEMAEPKTTTTEPLATIESQPTAEPSTTAVSMPSAASISDAKLTRATPTNTISASTPGRKGPHLGPPIVVDISSTPQPAAAKPASEPVPPPELLAGGESGIDKGRSGEASTRRVKSARSPDVPWEKISE